MSDLAAEVTAALSRSILPSVIARGAVGLRVVAAEDGVVTLAADGSPGAVLPILGRIEAQIRAAVPAVTAVRLAPRPPTLPPKPPPPPPKPPPTWPRPPAPSWTPRSTRRSPPTAAGSPWPASADGLDPRPPRRRLPGLQPGRGHPQAGHRAGAARPPAPADRGRRRHRARGGHRAVLLPGETVTARPRVLLLVPARTYRAADFILAAERMHLDLVVASDGALPLGGRPSSRPVRPISMPAPAGSWP